MDRIDKKVFAGQILWFAFVLLGFACLNGYIYMTMTRRLANNFSGVNQAKMVDVGRFLPHEEGSDLPRIGTAFRLEENLPVLDGAAALVPVYAAVIDNVYPKGSVTYEGGVFSDDNYYGENFALDSKMQYQNTIRGFRAVVDGTTDIFFGAAPSEEQKQYAREQGVELVYVPIGLEAFVFFVNQDNPVDDLTTEQVRKIYVGEYRNWKEVGGADRVINPVTRLQGSGSQTAMEKFMGDREIAMKSPLAVFGGSIGYSFRYYMAGMVDNKKVKMLSLNGSYPSVENIQNGSYPIVVQFYAIYRADYTNENIPALIEWICSEEGQTIIEETGYVKVY